MAEERKQSPHYIPELDPNSKKSTPPIIEKTFLWLEYLRLIVLIGSFLLAVVAWVFGWESVFISAVIVCALLALSFILFLTN